MQKLLILGFGEKSFILLLRPGAFELKGRPAKEREFIFWRDALNSHGLVDPILFEHLPLVHTHVLDK